MHKTITIITPVFNQVEFIEQTILSVLNQNYPKLEYIIIDGGSTDGTIDVIKNYQDRLSLFISEKDKGMYDALNKGFENSTGEIMGWINADDLLMPNSVSVLNSILEDLPNVEWIQGLNSWIDLHGQVIHTRRPKIFSKYMFLKRDYKFIQQESTFWRRSLWQKSGSTMNKELHLAGDFELWFRFSHHAKLFVASVPLGAWRRREGQLSSNLTEYLLEIENVIRNYNPSQLEKRRLKKINFYELLKKLLISCKILSIRWVDKRLKELYEIENLNLTYDLKAKKFLNK
jgi:glycosyltransferase involved in cell wall biosynthesis